MLAYDLGGVCGGLARRVKFDPHTGDHHLRRLPRAGQRRRGVQHAHGGGHRDGRGGQDGRLRRPAAAGTRPSASPTFTPTEGWIFNGINQHGQFFMAMHSGMAPGAVPASTSRDGIDTGGHLLGAGHGGLQRRGQRAGLAGADPLPAPEPGERRRRRAATAAAWRAEEAWILHGTDSTRHADLQQRELRQVPGSAGRQPRAVEPSSG